MQRGKATGTNLSASLGLAEEPRTGPRSVQADTPASDSQMRRAAVSVPANIAEGFKRRGKPDKARQMNIAQGSLEELQYYFILCNDLSYLAADAIGDRANEVGRMLTAYTQRILDSRF